MTEKKKPFPFPELSEDPTKIFDEPLKLIDSVKAVIQSFDIKIKQFDTSFDKLDSVLVSPADIASLPPGPMLPTSTKEEDHLSYEGQSDVSYCIECAVKHSQTAKVLMREAVQRAQAGSPSSDGVQEKVRGVIEELSGYENDTMTVKNEKVASLNDLGRNLRKFIYMTNAEVGGASIENLREIKDMIDKLVDATYQVRANDECIACTTEDLCGGNIECIEFVEEAAKNVNDPDEFKRILSEARKKYGK